MCVRVANWYSHTGLCLRKLAMTLMEMEADEKMVLAGIVRWDKECMQLLNAHMLIRENTSFNNAHKA